MAVFLCLGLGQLFTVAPYTRCQARHPAAYHIMRLRLLIRRLSVSLPRVAVRRALPWPFRWAVLAVVFGFCVAIELWAFQLGREIAELDGGAKIELQQARAKLVTLQAKLSAAVMAQDKAQNIADTAGTLVNTEKEATTGLMAQNRRLDAENRKLKTQRRLGIL